jgi:ubiquinone/menaquinone biosynthesis C-methylase UbiE
MIFVIAGLIGSSLKFNRKACENNRMIERIEQFGQIDIYLFDQILRGRITSGMTVLDAGCADGRNLVYLMRAGNNCYGVDSNSASIDAVRRLAKQIAPALPHENFRVEEIEAMSFPSNFADLIISSAVLHFAADDRQFDAMLREMWRVLKPGGLFFCRLASTIGMESRFRQIKGRRFLLPDSSERYLVDEEMLMRFTASLGGRLMDPLKTTVVQNQRCMTTWVVRKNEK